MKKGVIFKKSRPLVGAKKGKKFSGFHYVEE
jgi:hypothetical protein